MTKQNKFKSDWIYSYKVTALRMERRSAEGLEPVQHRDGASAVHCHMTNRRISDIEILEKRYPIIAREFSLRQGSEGAGLHPGRLGVTRIIECHEPLTFSMISERRVTTPYGLKGGEDGASGQT
jgi:N-methylhydantoinase B/oxoprolinase/acetone carboxylase alpha subunit